MANDATKIDLVRLDGFDSSDLPPAETLAISDGITIENRSGYDYVVAVANKVLGVAGTGYVRNGSNLKIATSWAWWDVYGLSQSSGSHVFLTGVNPVVAYTTWSKKMVGWKDTVTIK